MDPRSTMPLESCKPTTVSSGRRPPTPLCRGKAQDGPRARPEGRAADRGHIALYRGRAHGRPRARPGGRAEGRTRIARCRGGARGGPPARLGARAPAWTRIATCRGRAAGGPRTRPGGRAAGWNRIGTMPLECCKLTPASSGRRPPAPSQPRTHRRRSSPSETLPRRAVLWRSWPTARRVFHGTGTEHRGRETEDPAVGIGKRDDPAAENRLQFRECYKQPQPAQFG